MNEEHERLQRLEEKLDSVRIAVAELTGMLPTLCRRVSRLENEVWGDGRVGLSVKVNALIWLASVITGLMAVSVGNSLRVLLGF